MNINNKSYIYSQKPRVKSHRQEQGIALVVGLLLLLVMTVLGIAAMRGTLLQERMSANTQQQAIVFQGAEAAIRTMWVKVDAKPVVAVGATPPESLLSVAKNSPATDTTLNAAPLGNNTTSSATITYVAPPAGAPKSCEGNELDINAKPCNYYRIVASSVQTNTNASAQHQEMIFYNP